MAPIETVTFDFWNTLVGSDHPDAGLHRFTAVRTALAGRGVVPSDDDLVAAFGHARARHDDAWRANRADYGVDAALADMDAFLGLDATPEELAEIRVAFVDPDPAVDPPLAANIVHALDGLRAAGVRIGIVCDVGFTPGATLRRFLDGHGILDRFDHWSFSDEVGRFKPDPVIFQHALDGLGGRAATHAHVGDLRRTDVAGANALGMTSVRYTGFYDDPGDGDAEVEGDGSVEASVVVADHADLVVALGLHGEAGES
jgi:putative hydrolase of the HAD superfamily